MKPALKICLLVLLAAGSTTARAQGASEQTHEIGVWGGITNYFGDLNTKTSFKFVRPGAGVFYRYNIKYRGAWRTSVNWGTAEFDDAKTNMAWNWQRNLSFRSQIFDISSVIEFNFFKYDKGSKKHWYTPFIGTGIALFFFNPQAILGNTPGPLVLSPNRTHLKNFEQSAAHPALSSR